jgi:hypothetical protein
MPELDIGDLAKLFAGLAAEIEVKAPLALTSVALAVQKQAVINASTGAHPYGTKTPAWPGSGPARISGTLVRSITHTGVQRTAIGWETRVGPARGFYPTYRTPSGGSFTSKTQSATYGEYLERGLRNGAKYPWLLPAFQHGVRTVAPIVFRALFVNR